MAAEEVVEDIVENAANLIEAKSMGSADGLYISRAGLVRLGILGAIIATGAGYVGYKLAQKNLRTKYEDISAKEIAQAKEFYSVLHKKEGFATPQKAVETLRPVSPISEAANALRTYQGEEEDEPEDDGPVVIENSVNVFVQSNAADEGFDLEEEMKTRSPDKPYIIHEEEFMINDPEFAQTQLTYYEGDGTLADEQDQEIPFADPIVGEENLLRFGHGAGDDRIVFVRNERLSTDFEIAKHDGKFAHEVLGLELEHSYDSHRRHLRRDQRRSFRGDDA